MFVRLVLLRTEQACMRSVHSSGEARVLSYSALRKGNYEKQREDKSQKRTQKSHIGINNAAAGQKLQRDSGPRKI